MPLVLSNEHRNTAQGVISLMRIVDSIRVRTARPCLNIEIIGTINHCKTIGRARVELHGTSIARFALAIIKTTQF